MRATVHSSHGYFHASVFVGGVVLCALMVFSASVASAAVVGGPGVCVGIQARCQGNGNGAANGHRNQTPPGRLRAQEHWPDPNRPVWSYQGNYRHGNSWSVEYEIEADPDPYLYATFTLSNFTDSALDFTVDANLPIDPQIIGGFLAGGSVSGTLLDLNSNDGVGASLASITGTPIYTARIDGVDFQTLLDDPQLFVSADGETGAFGPATFGAPVPSLVSEGSILSEMEIEINATVGPHSIAVVVATFETRVPEPASLGLVTIGLSIVALRRRRRK